MRLALLSVLAVAIAGSVQGQRSALPIAPGLYCLKAAMTGFTGTGPDIPLGDFIMSVEVSRSVEGHAIKVVNSMPDSAEVLVAETAFASVLRDGSLAFSFTDGWQNKGRARVYPNGKVDLVMTEEAPSPLNQIARNYGTFDVSAAACSAEEFQR